MKDMIRKIMVVLILVLFVSANANSAETYIVKAGKANAEIVVRENPPRLLKLATEELQTYLKKITGAELPIVHKRSKDYPIAIYVGKSEGTDALGIVEDGLDRDAYQMVSGPDYLVLLGLDSDFEPGKVLLDYVAKNSKAARGLYKSKHKPSGICPGRDKGGSLQAVYGFLRDLGVRWYMSGELGEVVPEHDTVVLPTVNKTVVPDFRYRSLRLGNISNYPWYELVWNFRLGLNDETFGGAHGMRQILYETKQQEKHPEYFALYGNERSNSTKYTSAHACYSHPGLKEVVLNYAKMRFDVFNDKVVSIMPEDGFRECQCEMCIGKTPSELVWSLVDSVSRELYKTHPDRFVFCGAYTSYQKPPKSIKKFLPNVVVRISWMRPGLDDATRWAEYWELVQAWASRLGPKRLQLNANVQWSSSPKGPVIFPRSIARELSALNGICLGESSSVPRRAPRDSSQKWANPGLSHLNTYVLCRYMWDTKLDLEVLLNEYYTLFYGPASDEMRKAFEFEEGAYVRDRKPSTEQPLETRIKFVKLLMAAREKAGETIYGKRIQVILDEMDTLKDLEQALADRIAAGDPRKDAPVVLAGDPAAGKKAPVYHLREYKTGEEVSDEIATTFQVKWEDNFLVFDVHCKEPDLENMPITPDVWGGDSVALMIESPDHSYYQIEVNPDGKIFDADRSKGRWPGMDKWGSMADVSVKRGDDYWQVVVRLPVLPVAEGADDPLHFMVGSKPTQENPWFFNIGRSRGIDGRKVFTFSPVKESFHEPLHFAKLMVK